MSARAGRASMVERYTLIVSRGLTGSGSGGAPMVGSHTVAADA